MSNIMIERYSKNEGNIYFLKGAYVNEKSASNILKSRGFFIESPDSPTQTKGGSSGLIRDSLLFLLVMFLCFIFLMI